MIYLQFLLFVGKVNMNMPPNVAASLMTPPQYMLGNPNLPTALYGFQQPAAAMYSAPYGGGIEDLAALQRNAGLHTLVGSAAAAQQPAVAAVQQAAASVAQSQGAAKNQTVAAVNSKEHRQRETLIAFSMNEGTSFYLSMM